MADAVIEFQHVSKIYKRLFSEEKIAALSDVSFEALPGQVCAFLGPNGAGKTTSISILMGFFFANSGQVRVFGYPPGDIRAKEQIGFLPENFAFHKFLTAPKLLRFHLQLAGRDPAHAGSLIAELLAKARGGDVAFDDLGGADPLNLVRSDLKDIGAANFELSEAAKEAQTTIDQVRNENKAALEILAAEIATAKAGADQQIRDGAIRESMEKLRKEAQALAKDWDAVAAAIKALEELRTSKLKNFPVNGLEVREDNEVWMKGRKLDDWNKGEQLMYAFEIGILGAGELGLQVWDEYEHLDSENQKLVEEFVVESGLTVLAFCVASAEEVKQHGKKLRSEPAGALVA